MQFVCHVCLVCCSKYSSIFIGWTDVMDIVHYEQQNNDKRDNGLEFFITEKSINQIGLPFFFLYLFCYIHVETWSVIVLCILSMTLNGNIGGGDFIRIEECICVIKKKNVTCNGTFHFSQSIHHDFRMDCLHMAVAFDRRCVQCNLVDNGT